MPDYLSPQLTFPGLTSWWSAVHLCAVLVAGFLIWRLMQWERPFVSRSTGWLLLGLRVSALIVVLLTLWQPTLAWVVDQQLTGKVVVAIDASDSMRTSDLQATTAERLRWFSSLGWLRHDPAAIQLAERTAESNAPDAAVPSGVEAQTWTELTQRVNELSRFELARRSLLEGGGTAWNQLNDMGECSLLLYGGNAVTVDPNQSTEWLSHTEATLQPETTAASSVLKTIELGRSHSPVLAVILMTDGRDANASLLRQLSETFGSNGVPLFPVLVGSTRRPRDLAIVSIDSPLAVYRGDQPSIKVLISTSGFEGETLDVTLDLATPDESTPPQVRTITTNDGPQLVEFQVAAEELGERTYSVSVPIRAGETRDDNNRREFVLQVVDDRSRVLLVDGEPRWEFRYLEIAMSRDERVEVASILFDQPYMGVMRDPYFPRNWADVAGGPTSSGLAGRDLVVIGDVSPESFPPERWKDVEQYVSEQGGTLVLCAGRAAMPLGIRAPELEALLPITRPQPVLAPVRLGTDPTARGWTWTLTPEGEHQTPLQMLPNPIENQQLWNLLPGAGWAVMGTPKAAATVWAEGRVDDQSAPVPLLVHQHYGLGQVLWLATDATWRWRFRSADQFHHRFWGQLARFAAESKLASGNELAQFGPTQARFEAGAPVEFQARWSARFLQNASEDRQAVAQVLRNDQVVAEVPLMPEARRPLISSGQGTTLPPGDYTARLISKNLDLGPSPLESRFSIAAPATAELAELAANAVLLKEIAEASGGKLMQLDELDQIPQQLRPYEAIASAPQERPLWDRWPTLVVLTMILTTEWIIRRQNGLP